MSKKTLVDKTKNEKVSEKRSMKISKNFDKEEFACKCGCGFDDINPLLVLQLQTLRDALNAPLIVTSGCRCRKHNKAVGGASHSDHLKGNAADITCVLGARKIFETLLELVRNHRCPKIRFIRLYLKKNFVHVSFGGGKIFYCVTD